MSLSPAALLPRPSILPRQHPLVNTPPAPLSLFNNKSLPSSQQIGCHKKLRGSSLTVRFRVHSLRAVVSASKRLEQAGDIRENGQIQQIQEG
jgi:hypothetical protein